MSVCFRLDFSSHRVPKNSVRAGFRADVTFLHRNSELIFAGHR